jgi:signal transduction histidine kinase
MATEPTQTDACAGPTSETPPQLVPERERALALEIERLRALDRAKDEFVSNVTHELRTPLTNVRLYLGLLQRGRPEKHDHYVDVLVRETERLGALVDDLLELSRLDVARLGGPPERLPVDLVEVVTAAMERASARASEADVTLHVSVDHDLPRVSGDAVQLARAVDNLVGNALAYTPRGGSVDVRLGAEGKHVTLRVSDTGIGIPPSERDRVFERFFRGERARSLGVPGTGLGLPIVREVVCRHGGSVSIGESMHASSGGSCVTVQLPVDEATEADA